VNNEYNKKILKKFLSTSTLLDIDGKNGHKDKEKGIKKSGDYLSAILGARYICIYIYVYVDTYENTYMYIYVEIYICINMQYMNLDIRIFI
jgi:hypothetical protein